MSGGDSNARDQERVKVEAFVKVSNTDGDHEYVFRTRDLSISGLFLYTRVAHIYPFKVGSTLALELYDYDEFLVCTVVVVRVVESGSAEADRYPTGFGVRITQCDDINRGRLQTMIDRVKAAGELY
ncbi:MAG: PilZ domain-containing protein [Deltaproteobacteria bacterium]|nr:PilZ domain-containing protein [Deltaproteobacteria bacterium]